MKLPAFPAALLLMPALLFAAAEPPQADAAPKASFREYLGAELPLNPTWATRLTGC